MTDSSYSGGKRGKGLDPYLSKEVLRLTGEGKDVPDISRELKVRPDTVRAYLDPEYREKDAARRRKLRAEKTAAREPEDNIAAFFTNFRRAEEMLAFAYSDEGLELNHEWAAAIADLIAEGHGYDDIHRITGIPKPTITRYANPASRLADRNKKRPYRRSKKSLKSEAGEGARAQRYGPASPSEECVKRLAKWKTILNAA